MTSLDEAAARFEDRLNEHIRSLTGDFVPQQESEKFLAEVEETDAESLSAWLAAMAPSLIARRMCVRLNSDRQTARRRAGPRAFAAAAADGDAESLVQFDVHYRVDAQNTERQVRDMTGADHTFVAAQHQRRGNHELFLSAFHRAIARKVGKKRTADVMDEATYVAIYRSLVEKREGAA